MRTGHVQKDDAGWMRSGQNTPPSSKQRMHTPAVVNRIGKVRELTPQRDGGPMACRQEHDADQQSGGGPHGHNERVSPW